MAGDVGAASLARPSRCPKKSLQDTGPMRFRQIGFLDFGHTPQYTSRFLSARVVDAAAPLTGA